MKPYKDHTIANLKIKKPNTENVQLAIESKKNRVKLIQFNAIIELITTSETTWYPKVNDYFAEKISYPELDKTRRTLYTLVLNPEKECINPFAEYAKANNLAESERFRVAALATRFMRFRLRLMILDGLMSLEPQKTVGIARKYQSIIEEMKNKHFYITLGNSPKEKEGLIITVNSSCANIAKELARVEKELKTLLIGLQVVFGVLVNVPFASYPQIMQAIESIAPFGLQGVEPDYYYFWRMVLAGPQIAMLLPPEKPDETTASTKDLALYAEKVQLVESQSKQWNSILREVGLLLSFLSYRTTPITILDLSYLMSSPVEGGNIINQKFATFFGKDPISKNTFSRIVQCANHLVPLLWLRVFQHVHESHTSNISAP